MHLKNHFILRYLNNHFHCIFTLLSGIEEGKMLKKGKLDLSSVVFLLFSQEVL